jgi:DMSO reductase family type II enzyme molybdopterin subunit
MANPSPGDLASPGHPVRQAERAYRDRWKWDRVVQSSHAVDCYPTVGSCPYQVYLKDEKILFQEPAGTFPTIEEGVPDFNPMGCQKGACWHEFLGAKERVLYPLKRAGERGEGKWQRISWDKAMTEIADGIIDAIQEVGPESVFCPSGANALAWGMMTQRRFNFLAGFPLADFDADIGDCTPGMYLTWGKYVTPSEDDYAHSELILIWHCNPSYTRIPTYHFLTEARYKGAELVIIAPDVSPSALHSDYHVPVNVGSDAALCLSMCKVILDEGLTDTSFVKEQTDLSLLVRLDDRRFLRASDLEEGGSEEQLYFYDERSGGVTEAPRGTLSLGNVVPALEGRFTVTLRGGRRVRVAPAFELLKERLREYEPEMAAVSCGVHPSVIRSLARKVATKKTHVFEGLGTGKYYHGDLMGRAMYLLLALTGNWGKKGTGPAYWNGGPSTGIYLNEPRRRAGREEAEQLLAGLRQITDALKAEDPTRSDEIASVEMMQRASVLMSPCVPPVWWWYYHCGYRDVWNRREWNDPSMPREFDEYVREALEKNWWAGVNVPLADKPPRVLMEVGGNLFRRTRGGQSMFLKNLWPQLKLIVSVDIRMTTTGLFSDYVLPAAQQYERPHVHGLAATMFFTLLDKAVEPAGEAKPEWQIYRLLAKKLSERGKARGITEYKDGRGRTYRLDTLEEAFTGGYTMVDEEAMASDAVEATVLMGTIPEGTTMETMREKGMVRMTDWGPFPHAQSYASEVTPDETVTPFRNHVEKKVPYPTFTRRAQFYIDHEWFLEAGEELPAHKAPPKMGGDYPLMLTSGHNRWSVHGTNIVNRLMLETHRGHPHLVVSPFDAAARGIGDGEEVRVHNDMGAFFVRVKLSPSARPGQVICYTGWDPYQFRNMRGPSDVEGAMVKWLHFAGGYGHLRYWPFMWQPTHVDRATRVEVSKIG